MLSIIIPTIGRHQSLLRLLNSIAQQNFPQRQIEVLVVFNKNLPKNTLPSVIDESLQVKTLISPQKGANHARNTGIRASKGDILLFIDDDCFLSNPNYLQKIWSYHEAYPDIVAVGGPYELAKKSSFWDRAYHRNLSDWLLQQTLPLPQTRFLLGGNASYKAPIFRDGWRFTPGIVYGGSETPLNLKIYDTYGPQCIFDDLKIEHQTRISFSEFVSKAYRQGQGFAIQTKMMPEQIVLPRKRTHLSLFMSIALAIYDFYFMVGFRKSIQERKYSFLPFLQECWQRFKKPFVGLQQNVRFVHRYVRKSYET